MTGTSIAETQPQGLRTHNPGTWRPERDIRDSLFAMAAQVNADDEDFDQVAGIAATRLLLAGAELDVVAGRRERAARTTVVTVEVSSRGPSRKRGKR